MTYLKLSGICVLSTLLMLGCVKKEEPQTQQDIAAQEEPTVPAQEENTEAEFTQLVEIPSQPNQSNEATIIDQETTVSISPSSPDVAAPAQTAVANQPHASHIDEAGTEDDAIAAALKAAQPALQQ